MLPEQEAKHKAWLRDWKDGLASCNECDCDYRNNEVEVVNGEKCCPHCLFPEDKTYYYCPEDGSKGCECRWH